MKEFNTRRTRRRMAYYLLRKAGFTPDQARRMRDYPWEKVCQIVREAGLKLHPSTKGEFNIMCKVINGNGNTMKRSGF